MCGIAGVLTPRQNNYTLSNIINITQKMSLTLHHRGPDSSGLWSNDENIALAHTRLSIQDLSSHGHQPMASSNQRYILSYNGEVYNFLALRKELEKLGCTFIGHSDTEVLLAAFEQWGLEKALTSFNGMFALALWDKQERTLTLALDRMGKKPLYYGWVDGNFVFASELKAIEAHPSFTNDINKDALTLYLSYNYVPAPHSIYENIHKLSQGSYLTINEVQLSQQSHLTTKHYWSPFETALAQKNSPFEGTLEQASSHLESLIIDSTRIRMISDVPLGVMLSGGIDSTTVAAIAQSQSKSAIKTFSIGFNNNKKSEAAAAKEIAKYLGTDHHELYLNGQDALSVLPNIPEYYDEPFGDSSQIPTYLLSKLAKDNVTVALTGDGGDELFYGYKRYFSAQKVWGANRNIPQLGRTILSGMLSGIGGLTTTESKLLKHASDIKANHPADLYRSRVSTFIDPKRLVLGGRNVAMSNFEQIKALGIQDPGFNFMLLDFTSYLTGDILVKVDRASMAVSLETRSPLLDHRIAEFAWQLPKSMKYQQGQGKHILRNLLSRHVPTFLWDRPKQGFGSPLRQWLSGSLKDWAGDLLSVERLKQQGIMDAQAVNTLWTQCQNNPNKSHSRLWNILMLQAWLAKHGK